MSYSAPPPPPPPPEGPGGGQPGYGYGGYAQPQTNKKAIWALVTGLVGLLCCGLVGIAGIVLGNQAKAEIDGSGGAQTGRGMAQAGFILGIVALGLMVLQVILFATGSVNIPSSP